MFSPPHQVAPLPPPSHMPISSSNQNVPTISPFNQLVHAWTSPQDPVEVSRNIYGSQQPCCVNIREKDEGEVVQLFLEEYHMWKSSTESTPSSIPSLPQRSSTLPSCLSIKASTPIILFIHGMVSIYGDGTSMT